MDSVLLLMRMLVLGECWVFVHTCVGSFVCAQDIFH